VIDAENIRALAQKRAEKIAITTIKDAESYSEQ